MKIGIIGYGHVGKLMHKEFKEAIIYDPNLNIGSMEEINKCEAAFVCVPTPQNDDGSCDTSIVEETLANLKVKLAILRSTVYIGFTDYAADKFNLEVVFQPEYYGETVNHPFAEPNSKDWISFGGTPKAIGLAIDVYKNVCNSNIRIIQGPAREIEMAKYMENAFLATKVTFINEMYDICEKMGIDYNVAREAWVADPRIGTSHSFIYKENRGFGGKCLPKDTASIKKQADDCGVDSTILTAVIDKNKKIYKRNDK